jgi:hypothetical protein
LRIQETRPKPKRRKKAMFKLRVTLSDGFEFDLDERYARQFEADRAAANYIRDYSDPCGLGVRVRYISTIIEE